MWMGNYCMFWLTVAWSPNVYLAQFRGCKKEKLNCWDFERRYRVRQFRLKNHFFPPDNRQCFGDSLFSAFYYFSTVLFKFHIAAGRASFLSIFLHSCLSFYFYCMKAPTNMLHKIVNTIDKAKITSTASVSSDETMYDETSKRHPLHCSN